jgi:hypothetical protein
VSFSFHSPHRPSGVIGEADVAVHRLLLKKANIHAVIFPFDVSYRIWWTITTLGAIGTAFFLPYEIAFQETHDTDEINKNDYGAIVEIILQIIFCIDIILNFDLAFYKDERLIYQRTEIIKNYFGRMFWIDLFGVFPFETVALWVTGNLGKSIDDVLLFSLWRLPCLTRLHRLKKLNDILQYDGHVSFLWFTLLRNFAAVLVVAHW